VSGNYFRFLSKDVRTGGHWKYTMHGPDGVDYPNNAKYLEVYTQSFCDENENITRHPMAPTWPEVMKTTVSFEAEGPDKTRVTLKGGVDGSATPTERETFNKAKAGMSQGWGGSFDNLEEYLAKQ
jgi:uncharacterized protein YndB with AHSA1/START domain